jgi:hypothetical protein
MTVLLACFPFPPPLRLGRCFSDPRLAGVALLALPTSRDPPALAPLLPVGCSPSLPPNQPAMTPISSPAESLAYQMAVIALYLDLPETPLRVSPADQLQARYWFQHGVPFAIVQTALWLGSLLASIPIPRNNSDDHTKRRRVRGAESRKLFSSRYPFPATSES